MTIDQIVEPSSPLPTDAQLSARACIVCSSTAGPLTPAGHHYIDGTGGARLGWAVVTCPAHTNPETDQ